MRLPLGVKMTLASTLLVALLVTALGYLHTLVLRDVQAERRDQMRATFEAMVMMRAETRAADLAVAVRDALEGTELGTLSTVVHGLVATDPGVVFARIADREGRILADSTRPVDVAELSRVAGVPLSELLTPAAYVAAEEDRRLLHVRQPIVADAQPGAEARGVVIFGYDLAPLDQELATIDAQRRDSTRRSLRYTLLIDGIALLLGALFSLFAAQRFASPIRRLAATAARIARGNLDARVAVTTSDEVGTLGHQFNHMADRVQELLDEAVSKAELERELNVAREIQSVLVPAPGLHSAPGIEVAGHYEPASLCGGDFWDLATLPRGRSNIVIGDVTGHGVPAAMLTATAKASIDTLRQIHAENLQVAETMRVLDRVIRETGRGTYFMTAIAAVLDSTQGTLFFTGAGHPPGLLLRWTESGLKVKRLVARGNRLGDGRPGGFEARRVRVEAGDLVIWYTDGLTEAVNGEGAQFGTRRLLRLLSRLDTGSGPEEVVRRVTGELDGFRNGTPLEDDVTLVVGRVR